MTINVSQDTLTIDVVTQQPAVDIITQSLSLDVVADQPVLDVLYNALTLDVVTQTANVDVVTNTLSLDVASGGIVPANIDLAAEAAINLSALRVVRLDAANKAVYADNDTAANANAVGITTSAATAGATAAIRYAGLLEDLGWAWTQGPIYIGTSGTLTQTAPAGGLIVREVARAISATKIIIDIEPLIQTV